MQKFTTKAISQKINTKTQANLDAPIEIRRRFSTNSYGWFKWVFDTLNQLPKEANVLELGTDG